MNSCNHIYFKYITFMQFPLTTSESIRVKVTPGAKKDEYMRTLPDGTIKILLGASPTDGKANRALIDFIEKNT